MVEDEIMEDISDWAKKIRNIFKPKPIFVSTTKKGGIDWGEISDLKNFNDEIVKKSNVPKFTADKYEEKLLRFALKFRTREVWVYIETKNEHGVVSINFLFYPSRMNLKDCESLCYSFDRIIFMKRSEFRKLPKSKNFFLVLKYRKIMRKFLGVTR